MIRSSALLVLGLALLTLGCGGGGGGGPAAAFALLVPSSDGAANSLQPTLRWNPAAGAASYRLTLASDAAMTNVIETMTVATTSATTQTILADDDEVHVRLEALDAAGVVLETAPASRFRVVEIPPLIPSFSVTSMDPAATMPGYRLFNLFDTTGFGGGPIGYLVLVNLAGEIVWVHTRPGTFIEDARVLPNGNLLFICYDYVAGGGDALTHAVEMTWDELEVWNSRTGADPHHEIMIGPGGNYLHLRYEYQMVGNDVWEGDGLEIVDPATNQTLWSWNIFDYLSTSEFDPDDIMNVGQTGMGFDWTHSNTAVWDPARSLIWVSVRNLDCMLAVDYPSGAVVERFGNGGLGGPALMSHQHAIEIQPDGSILFFDNGNRRTVPVSRVVRFEWDETAGQVEVILDWTDSPPFYDLALGDSDRLDNGNCLINSGWNARLIELSPQLDTVWELIVNDVNFIIYRAEHVTAAEIPSGVLPF